MNVKNVNQLFQKGKWHEKGVFSQLEELRKLPLQFRIDFGLKKLPEGPGLISIRGARQYGKSTWLEQQMLSTLEEHGPGSCYYLNGDDLLNDDQLHDEILNLTAMFPKQRHLKRIFIDEITAVDNWQRAIKRLFDRGETRDVLLVTTGSKASDLRHGVERLPGRKGRLDRSDYIFTPLSFVEFEKQCGANFKKDTVIAYLLSGGSPIAANELVAQGQLPNYLVTLVRDWILGECAAARRSRNHMTWLIHALMDRGGTAISLAKLAREVNLANNTVLQGYLELLADLLCLGNSLPVDASRLRGIPRREHKYPFTNLLVAQVFDPAGPYSIKQWQELPSSEQGKWWEWLVAQELWRRAAIRGDMTPEQLYHFVSSKREIDFRITTDSWIEVKRGSASAFEFSWFNEVFPKHDLKVICDQSFDANRIQGVTMEEFLREDDF